MAPESFPKGNGTPPLFTRETDIWAYGTLLLEIFTCAEQPYSQLSNSEVGLHGDMFGGRERRKQSAKGCVSAED
jgi:hypothetical protein